MDKLTFASILLIMFIVLGLVVGAIIGHKKEFEDAQKQQATDFLECLKKTQDPAGVTGYDNAKWCYDKFIKI